jgi:PAS domain S-box-containing protein
VHLARALAESAWLFRALTENLDQCVFVLDRDGCCIAANDRFCRWLKRPHGEILGQPLAAVWPYPLSEQEAAAHERILRGEWIEAEEEGQRRGQTSVVRLRKAPLRDAEGTVCGVLCLFREVLIEPNRETSSGQSSSLPILGGLMSGALHDLGRQLALLSNSMVLLQTALPPGVAEAELTNLWNGVNQASAFIDRLLRLAHRSPGGLRPISPRFLDKTILVVESDLGIALLTTTILSQWGFHVLFSEDGRLAGEMYRDKWREIDLVVVEEDLPGQSGLELVNELLAINPLLAIVLVSAAGTPPSWRAATPGLSFLSKPYTPEQLMRCVWTALSAARNGDG